MNELREHFNDEDRLALFLAKLVAEQIEQVLIEASTETRTREKRSGRARSMQPTHRPSQERRCLWKPCCLPPPQARTGTSPSGPFPIYTELADFPTPIAAANA